MTPQDFVRTLETRTPAPAYLFLGPEAYGRSACRRALISKVLKGGEEEQGFIRHDLDDTDLPAVLDDARSFSLFTSERLIWVSGAEAAIPKGRAATSDDETPARDGGAALLAGYLRDPTPGTVVVFDCLRYELEGDDKTRIQRVQKFYSGVPQVEFARYTVEAARRLAGSLAKEKNLRIGAAELDTLVEALAGDASRVASEIEKLALYAGTEREITEADIRSLTPNAKATTIFALVAAVSRRDRASALEALDLLVREGEYLPLALSFLNSQFRQALVAKEARLTGSQQIQNYFSRGGTQMWKSRADGIAQTANAFSEERLRRTIVQICEADKALRDTRPDDRTVMENFVLELTGK